MGIYKQLILTQKKTIDKSIATALSIMTEQKSRSNYFIEQQKK